MTAQQKAGVDMPKAVRVAEAYCYDSGAPNAAKNLRATVAELIRRNAELEAALRQSGEAVTDAAELSRLANLHGTRSYAMDGLTGCTHQGWSFRPEQLANFAAALAAHDARGGA